MSESSTASSTTAKTTHHGHISSPSFFGGPPIEVSVLSSLSGMEGEKRPDVSLQIWTPTLTASFALHPGAACRLAAKLIEAANAAWTAQAEALAAAQASIAAAQDPAPLALYREPEAA